MNLEFYKTFYYVAKYGSISRASEYLYITQPAVSRSIKQLEEALGCSLFFRTPKGAKLSQEGEVLFRYIEQAFNFISMGEKKLNDVKGLLDGEIRIGASDTLCKHYLISYLKVFKILYPNIKIHVICPTTPGIISLLKAGKIDFGIINMPYEDDQLYFKSIMEVQDSFVAGEKFKHLSYKMQSLKDLSGYPFIFLEKNSNSRLFLDGYFADNSISITPDYELGNIDLLVQFAKNDFGIACVIRNFIEDDLDKGGLYEIKPVEKIPKRDIGVCWLKNVPLSAASKELINHLEFNKTTEF